jgi:hypothetical protein
VERRWWRGVGGEVLLELLAALHLSLRLSIYMVSGVQFYSIVATTLRLKAAAGVLGCLALQCPVVDMLVACRNLQGTI